jgi:hypothetical protein
MTALAMIAERGSLIAILAWVVIAIWAVLLASWALKRQPPR